MKVLLFSEGKNLFKKSGVGKALEHQMKALELAGVEYTLDPNDKYDIVHINTIGLLSEKVLDKAKKNGKKVIVHTHTTYEDFKNSFIFSNYFAPIIKKRLIRMYSKADMLISPSLYTKKLILSYGIKNKIEVVSNGVDTNKFNCQKKSKKIFKKYFNIEKPLVLSVGLPFERKGIIDFYKLAEKLPFYDFVWLGAKLNVIPKKIKKLLNNKLPNLKFPGFVSEDLLLAAFCESDVFLFPSYEENEGIVVLEALSSKTPLILRDIPVYDNWLSHGEHCLKSRNLDDFMKNIKLVINNEIDIKKMVDNGRRIAEERDLKKIGVMLKYIYGEIYERKG
ncbi:1,2-diacylglycerol-3-alpha-glucose alpha-1,2-glucosyltransferase [Marinitoga hydrogenitolerans DSM 16785]|uniref:1,2-diacylglycerol-3-alpha-glucose alpha-1,2-glucosyltransferase n=1 Tax=Marinitoga hydrogenitolerans (strain DSM 16785 / JCM 12826 / AT1271) TaxID=1122195 RepID=A0A1M4XKY4_MARH1|nr:glycosyltransferase [Marinitoga hydrogenitolerans]SHE94234.1 1,2-diacylglycerol-3-alpha-glucose alpha-1,2-glucosyltransferase [Marinitoga hydrogenitolerans DSM 16785]